MRPALIRTGAWAGLFLFVAGGIITARLDGMALVDLPFGPQVAGGPVIGPNMVFPTEHQFPGDAAIQTASIPEAPPAEDVAAAPDPAPVAEAEPDTPPEVEPAPQESALPKQLVFATEGAYPPFNFVDETGALKGIEVDFVYDVCISLKIACEIVKRDWDDLLPGLMAGEYDAVAASLRIPAQPAPGLAFTDAYFKTAAAYAVRKGDPLGVTEGPVAVQIGTRHEAYLLAKWGSAEVERYPDILTAYQALADGEVRAVLDDAVRLNRWLQDPTGVCCAIAGELITAPGYFGKGVGFAVRAEDEDLREALNGAIETLESEGRIAELSDRYFPFTLN